MKSLFILTALALPVIAGAKPSRPFHMNIGYEVCQELKCYVQTVDSGSRRIDLVESKPDVFIGRHEIGYGIVGQPLKAIFKIANLETESVQRTRFEISIQSEKANGSIASAEVSVADSEKINLVTLYGPYFRKGSKILRPYLILGNSGPELEGIRK